MGLVHIYGDSQNSPLIASLPYTSQKLSVLDAITIIHDTIDGYDMFNIKRITLKDWFNHHLCHEALLEDDKSYFMVGRKVDECTCTIRCKGIDVIVPYPDHPYYERAIYEYVCRLFHLDKHEWKLDMNRHEVTWVEIIAKTSWIAWSFLVICVMTVLIKVYLRV